MISPTDKDTETSKINPTPKTNEGPASNNIQ